MKNKLKLGQELFYVTNDFKIIKRTVNSIQITKGGKEQISYLYVFSNDIQFYEYEENLGITFKSSLASNPEQGRYFRDLHRAKEFANRVRLEEIKSVLESKKALLIEARRAIKILPLEIEELEKKIGKLEKSK